MRRVIATKTPTTERSRLLKVLADSLRATNREVWCSSKSYQVCSIHPPSISSSISSPARPDRLGQVVTSSRPVHCHEQQGALHTHQVVNRRDTLSTDFTKGSALPNRTQTYTSIGSLQIAERISPAAILLSRRFTRAKWTAVTPLQKLGEVLGLHKIVPFLKPTRTKRDEKDYEDERARLAGIAKEAEDLLKSKQLQAILLQAGHGPQKIHVALRKAELSAETGLALRDLRAIDSSFHNQVPTILARQRAIVVNLGHVKALLAADRVLLFNVGADRIRCKLVPNLQRRLARALQDAAAREQRQRQHRPQQQPQQRQEEQWGAAGPAPPAAAAAAAAAPAASDAGSTANAAPAVAPAVGQGEHSQTQMQGSSALGGPSRLAPGGAPHGRSGAADGARRTEPEGVGAVTMVAGEGRADADEVPEAARQELYQGERRPQQQHMSNGSSSTRSSSSSGSSRDNSRCESCSESPQSGKEAEGGAEASGGESRRSGRGGAPRFELEGGGRREPRPAFPAPYRWQKVVRVEHLARTSWLQDSLERCQEEDEAVMEEEEESKEGKEEGESSLRTAAVPSANGVGAADLSLQGPVKKAQGRGCPPGGDHLPGRPLREAEVTNGSADKDGNGGSEVGASEQEFGESERPWPQQEQEQEQPQEPWQGQQQHEQWQGQQRQEKQGQQEQEQEQRQREQQQFEGEEAQPFELLMLEGMLEEVDASLRASFTSIIPEILQVLRMYVNDEEGEGVLIEDQRRFLRAKNRLLRFNMGVNQIIDALKELLANDEDMAAMNLTRKSLLGRPLRPSEHSEVEELVENFYKRIEEVANEVEALISTIDATSEYLRTVLDSSRNKLIRIDVLLNMATCSMAAGGSVAAIFGMNLLSSMESQPYAFAVVTAGISLSSAAIFSSLYMYARKRRIL